MVGGDFSAVSSEGVDDIGEVPKGSSASSRTFGVTAPSVLMLSHLDERSEVAGVEPPELSEILIGFSGVPSRVPLWMSRQSMSVWAYSATVWAPCHGCGSWRGLRATAERAERTSAGVHSCAFANASKGKLRPIVAVMSRKNRSVNGLSGWEPAELVRRFFFDSFESASGDTGLFLRLVCGERETTAIQSAGSKVCLQSYEEAGLEDICTSPSVQMRDVNYSLFRLLLFGL